METMEIKKAKSKGIHPSKGYVLCGHNPDVEDTYLCGTPTGEGVLVTKWFASAEKAVNYCEKKDWNYKVIKDPIGEEIDRKTYPMVVKKANKPGVKKGDVYLEKNEYGDTVLCIGIGGGKINTKVIENNNGGTK